MTPLITPGTIEPLIPKDVLSNIEVGIPYFVPACPPIDKIAPKMMAAIIIVQNTCITDNPSAKKPPIVI